MGLELPRRVFGGHARFVKEHGCGFHRSGPEPDSPPPRWQGILFGRYQELRAHKLATEMAHWTRMKPLMIAPFAVITTALLIAAGYPAVRIAIVAGLDLTILGVLVWGQIQTNRTGDPSRGQPPEVMLLVHFAILVATGGTASPFSPMLLMQAAGAALVFGRSRRTFLKTASVVVQLVILFLLPPAIVGPAVIEPYRELLMAVTVAFTAAFLVLYINSLGSAAIDAGEELERIREDHLMNLLERTRALEAVSSRVAHELKNPLAAIKAIVQLLQRSADDRSKERLEVLHSEIARMEHILADYLSFSRPLLDLTPETVDLEQLSHEVLAVLEARAADAGVTIEHDGDSVSIQGDPRRLKEALLNLASNALEATPPGGNVRIFHRACAGGGAEIAISDTGKGIAPDVLPRIGTAFYTTREEGTGLGVVLAKRVVGQHGGELTYDSDVGRGTTVTMRLPHELPPCGQGARSRWCPDLAYPGKSTDVRAGVDPSPAQVALRGADPAPAAGPGGK